METWFFNHVLGVSLSVLLLGLPGPLGAGTPSNNSTDPLTAGFYVSASTDELSNVESNATSTSYSSESLSASQRNTLLTRAAAAGQDDTEQTQAVTENSSWSLEVISRSTEPLTSTMVVATSEVSSSSSNTFSSSGGSSNSNRGWKDLTNTEASSSFSSSSGVGSSSSFSSSSGVGSSSSSNKGWKDLTNTEASSSFSSSSDVGGSSFSSSSGVGSSSSSNRGWKDLTNTEASSSFSSSSDVGGSSFSSSSGVSSSSSFSSSSDVGGSSFSSSSDVGSSSSFSSSSGVSSSSSSNRGWKDLTNTEASSSFSSSSGVSSSSFSSSSDVSSSSSFRGWKVFTNTDQVPDASPAVPWEARSWMLTEDSGLPQDSPETTLRLGDASTSHAAVHTDSTYTSTAISRAGERTLLSVTSSSSNRTSSAFTEDSNSHQPPSTWGISASATETEDYTHSAPSTRTDSRDTTDQLMTHSFKRTFPETGSPEGPRGTQSLTGQPNTTHHQYTATSEETSNSTPPLRVTEPNTDQSEVSVSSTPSVTSPAEDPTNISGTEQEPSVTTSTESSTEVQSFSTQSQDGTEGVSSQTREDNMGLGLTTAPPTVSSSTSKVDNSLTDTPVLVTEAFLTTTPVTVTERSQITEEYTFQPTSSTSITTPPVSATSSSRFISTASSSTLGSPTEATVPYTTPSTTASTPAPRTSAAHATHHVSPSQTQGPSTWMANPTNATTLQIETSTGPPRITTTHSQRITTITYTHSTPTKSTEALQTTKRQIDRGTTELVTTTSPTKAPIPPRNPCVSNPCMNGGMCVSYTGHQFSCHCQQAWTGPTCSLDVDECERDPCPLGSRCVNTRGSFSCECPLGFDLEDGRTCTRAKTFLGTFSVNRQPHDPVVFKSATMHEIQREIIQLLNASLSVLRGYSRSTLSKKGEDGILIAAVNMFSISADVTSTEIYNSIQMSLSNCSSSLTHCRMVLHHQLTYHAESLCAAQKTQCDTERSTCTDNSGTANCQCLQGYYKHNPDDLSCLECGDGYKLENGTCVPCMFGFGGFNCGNFYKLIAIVVSPAGGALLLILIIALIVTCCKKDKNDINKIIFKSGDLQMSPYADFPKNSRISTEWGRETIEMQENGSTKNLLQMTDIYYSPALRNSDLERNGLYPFTGLPGSRHSCIYPAQWNPSFISDDSRRRDYF